MRECIFCKKPCRTGLCSECLAEHDDIEPNVFNKLLYAIASRDVPERKIKEDLEEVDNESI